MMDIKTKTFNHVLNTLKALGTEYVILEKDGRLHKHGSLQVAEKKQKIRLFPHGTYIKLVKDQGIEGMQVGDVRSFDPKGTRAESVRSTAITYATDTWGANSVITTINNGKIEVLRIA
jgi:hypothetical protein